MRATSLPIAVLGAAALTLSLTGCFGNPVENLVEGVIENQTGVDVDTSAGGGSAQVPDGWPGLPIPEGQIVSSLAIDTTYTLTIKVASDEVAGSVADQIEGLGYEVLAEGDMGELKTTVLQGPEWTVSLSWYTDPDSNDVLLNYGVAKTGS
jgi:hypothetical protein